MILPDLFLLCRIHPRPTMSDEVFCGKMDKLMDFNQAFQAYDTIDGANCQTLFGMHKTQREAAEEAVCEIGLNQLCEVKKEVFCALPQYFEMFSIRLNHLKEF